MKPEYMVPWANLSPYIK